jgi:hypothetical protein
MLGQLPETLSRKPQRAHAALQDVLAPETVLRPAATRGFLEAEFGLDIAPLAATAGGVSEIMVAGVRYARHVQEYPQL